MKRIRESLLGEHGSYILPLFWQHGEDSEIIRKEIQKIHDCGIREFCIESRPFEDFCGEKWWENLKCVIDECKRLNMKVWIFDDKHFPSGYANGALEEKYPHLRKWHLIEKNMDVLGPQKDAAVLMNNWLSDEFEESIVAVTAIKRSGYGEGLTDDIIDLTDKVEDGILYFDVPEGVWRVFVLIKTRDGVSGRSRYMIDDLTPASCRLMIDEVYEPHYKHFKDEFGKTIAGFFTDEPGFRNLPKGYIAAVGVVGTAMPWSDELIKIISESTGLSAKNYLPTLWYECENVSPKIRAAYMDAVSKLYSKNFCEMLGTWCRERNVKYIGHVLEDMNVSGRLGDGAGNYFRALSGQDMSGVDAVYHQILPGFNDISHAVFASTKNNDPEFYNFALAKLGASMAHIQKNKQGRALCEIFGGYGWAEGLTMMKWLVDHFLVSGINHFTPHAFSPKTDDPDCPPHLYGGGKNPQYKYLKILMDYTGRMCHILNDGKAVLSGAVMYHAEAEWCGGKFMYEQTPLKILLKSQRDFDIIPYDAFTYEGTVMDENGVMINGTLYPCIIVPECERLPKKCMDMLNMAKKKGVDVIHINSVPCGMDRALSHIVPLSEIADETKKYADVRLDKNFADVRIFHYRRENADIYVLNNESVQNEFSGRIEFLNQAENEKYVIYDALHNTITHGRLKNHSCDMSLLPYRLSVVVFGDLEVLSDITVCEHKCIKPSQKIDLKFDISLSEDGENFREFKKNSPLFNITGRDGEPHFCGTVRYETIFLSNGGRAVIDLGEAHEISTLYLNEKCVGTEICPPHKYEIDLVNGKNTLKIDVVTNPAYRERDKYSKFIMLKPSGVLGDITLEYIDEK